MWNCVLHVWLTDFEFILFHCLCNSDKPYLQSEPHRRMLLVWHYFISLLLLITVSTGMSVLMVEELYRCYRSLVFCMNRLSSGTYGEGICICIYIYIYKASFKRIWTIKTRSREEYHITTDQIWRTIHSNTSQVYLECAKLLHNTTARWKAD